MGKAAALGLPREKTRRLAVARAAMKRRTVAQAPRLTAGCTADSTFIAASLNYRRCAREYMKAHGAWADFAARNPMEDPAHADHHNKLIQARRALNGADEALSVAEEKLLGSRS